MQTSKRQFLQYTNKEGQKGCIETREGKIDIINKCESCRKICYKIRGEVNRLMEVFTEDGCLGLKIIREGNGAIIKGFDSNCLASFSTRVVKKDL